MPSNTVPNLTQEQLKRLEKLLAKYAEHIAGEQALAAEIIWRVVKWVHDDIE